MQTNLQRSSNETLSSPDTKQPKGAVGCHQLGDLWETFGPLPNFKNEFSIPIKEGRHKNASEHCMRRADLANNALQD
jgi:hypothetical protein